MSLDQWNPERMRVLRDGVLKRSARRLRRALYHLEGKQSASVERMQQGLHVEDAGAGFDPSIIEEGRAEGVGLSDMRERLELLGGHLRLSSAPSEGTQVEAAAPNERAGENDGEGGSEGHSDVGEAGGAER